MDKLTFIPELELPQGSDVWLARRRVVGTSTQCAIVVGEPPSYDGVPKTWRALRTERAFGSTFKGNLDTERGHRLEPLARAVWNGEHEGVLPPVEPIWCERTIGNVDGADLIIASSYDGYARDGDVHYWLEIKAPRNKNSKIWKALKAGRIPDDYYWQVVHQRATLGDHDAIGHFMAYLEDGSWESVAVEDDPRYKSGQFHRDVEYAIGCWASFLANEDQPGDMTMNQEWAAIENQLLGARSNRLRFEADMQPHKSAEERAKNEIKEMCGEFSGMRRVHGRKVNVTNRGSESFDLDAFRDKNPDFDLGPYTDYAPVYDVDRLRAENPDDTAPFVSRKDNWVVTVKKG